MAEKCVACDGTGVQKREILVKPKVAVELGYRDRSGKLLDPKVPKVKGTLHATDHPWWSEKEGKIKPPVDIPNRDPELVASGVLNA